MKIEMTTEIMTMPPIKPLSVIQPAPRHRRPIGSRLIALALLALTALWLPLGAAWAQDRATLTLQKDLSGGGDDGTRQPGRHVYGPNDQFTLRIDGPGGSSATTTGTGQDTGDVAVVVDPATPGVEYTFTETGANGADLENNYSYSYNCRVRGSDGVDRRHSMGVGNTFTVTPKSGEQIACIIYNQRYVIVEPEDDNDTTTRNTPVTTNVAANDLVDARPAEDYEFRGEPVGYQLGVVERPDNGSVSCNHDPDAGDLGCTYTPNTNFIGTDTYRYELCVVTGYLVQDSVPESESGPRPQGDPQDFWVCETALVTITIPGEADLTITKTNNTDRVVYGETTEYTIVASNKGPDAADDAIVNDSPSAGLTNCQPRCTESSGGAQCPADLSPFFSDGVIIPTFPSEATLTFTVTCDVQEAAATALRISNGG